MKNRIVILLVLCPALLSARTWTAKDGRTLQGESVSATADTVVVACYDGRTVTIPLSMLSDADVAYVRESTGSQPDESPKKAPTFPKLCGSNVTDENDRQLEGKYEKLAHMLSDGGPRAVSMFKDALAKDAAYWKQEESYNSKACAANATSDTKNSKSSKSNAKMAATAQQTTSADKTTSRIQARVTWLTKTLPDWLDSVTKDTE